MIKNKFNIKKRRRRVFSAFVLALAFSCSLFTSFRLEQKASASTLTNDTYTLVLPSLYVPAPVNSTYTYFYFMPMYLGAKNNNLVLYYPRSGDGNTSYYYELSTPYSLDASPYSLYGLVGALKNGNNTIYGNVALSSSQPPLITYELPNYDVLDYSPNNGLFFTQLSRLAVSCRVSFALDTTSTYTRLAYTFLDANGQELWKVLLTYIKPLSLAGSVLQTATPTFITSTVNLNAYAQELVSLASQTAFEEGRALGRQEGLNSSQEYSFNSLISAVINAPINAVKSIFDFDFLGVNLTSFILSVLTVLVVLKVVGMLI